MKRDDQSRRRPSLRVYLLGVFALTMLLGLPYAAQAQWTASGNDISNNNTGNVGIGTGTTSPNAKLVVASGNVGLGSNNIAPWAGASSVLESTNTSIFFGQATDMHFLSNAYLSTGWKYKTANAAADYYLFQGGHGWRVAPAGSADGTVNWIDAMTINNSGNVGIGTTSPRGLLDAAGDGKIVTVGVNSTYGAGMVLSGSAGTATLSNNAFISAGAANFNNVDTAKSSAAIELANQDIYFRRIGSGGAGASVTESMFIQGSTGNVGIGTNTPTHTLEVNGSANVTGAITGSTINATYQDVAEWVPATHALPAGTVVILNPNESNQVMASTKSYDTRVAGVVSERPGLALGEAGANKVLVATTGRVKVKVDATRAAIHVGDLLVTSDVEGLAMKSVPLDLGGTPIHRPGTLIGKALEPLEKGTGEILVLLSLQ